jgi:tRNA nucleotidyltransferase (CCA-adding enzyme)
MLRAIRFVSKLGFEIETDTLNAIKELRHLIHNVSIERVMVEISKIFKGKHRQKAVQYLVKSKLHEELFGLQKGMEYIQHIETEVKPLEAFMISFILDEFNETWKFSNTNRRVIEKVMQLHEVTKEGIWNKFIVFSNKKDICLLTNRINVFLGYKDQSDLINEIDDGLIVKDVCGLAFKGQDILQLTTLKKRSVIALVIDDLLFNVIMEIMPNDYDILKEFALKRVEELQKELER